MRAQGCSADSYKIKMQAERRTVSVLIQRKEKPLPTSDRNTTRRHQSSSGPLLLLPQPPGSPSGLLVLSQALLVLPQASWFSLRPPGSPSAPWFSLRPSSWFSLRPPPGSSLSVSSHKYHGGQVYRWAPAGPAPCRGWVGTADLGSAGALAAGQQDKQVEQHLDLTLSLCPGGRKRVRSQRRWWKPWARMARQ